MHRLALAVIAALAALAFAVEARAAPPPNDNFADAALLAGGSGSVTGTSAEATKEPDEPDHAGQPGGSSVWYRWTAPENGVATFETCGSDFDTVLAAYTGEALAALTLVEASDDVCDLESRIRFPASAGTTYRIAVDGFEGASGPLTLAWRLLPAPPDNEAAPGLSGSAREGELLTASAGRWRAADTVTYAWLRCAAAGATPVNVALGKPAEASREWSDSIAARATDGNFHTIWNAGAFAPQRIEVQLGGAFPVQQVRLGVAQHPDGPTEHAVYGRVAGKGLDYVLVGGKSGSTRDGDWLELAGPSVELQSVLVETTVSPSWVGWREIEVLSGCTAIAGATQPTYRLTPDDIGSTVRAVVTAANAGGATSLGTSRTATVVALAPLNVDPPLITGEPRVGRPLVATTGNWSGKPPLFHAFQWQSCDPRGESCGNIAGATESTYVATPLDVGQMLRVVVTATNAGGSTSAASARTDIVRGRPVVRRCVVPRLRGLALRDARAALRRSRCRLGAVRRVHSARVRRGRVVAQRPAAGTRMRAGARVSVVVSKGPRR